GGAVLPRSPDHPAPGTPEDADRMLMGAAARAREGPERLGGIAVGLEQPVAGASTHASKLSRLPPAALKRGRIAATWLGCTAITRRPASSRRSTSSPTRDRKSTRLNSSHVAISYAVFCLKKKKRDAPAVRISSAAMPQ